MPVGSSWCPHLLISSTRSVTGAHVIAPEAERLHEILRDRQIDSRLLDSHELIASGVTTAEVGEIAGTVRRFPA